MRLTFAFCKAKPNCSPRKSETHVPDLPERDRGPCNGCGPGRCAESLHDSDASRVARAAATRFSPSPAPKAADIRRAVSSNAIVLDPIFDLRGHCRSRSVEGQQNLSPVAAESRGREQSRFARFCAHHLAAHGATPGTACATRPAPRSADTADAARRSWRAPSWTNYRARVDRCSWQPGSRTCPGAQPGQRHDR